MMLPVPVLDHIVANVHQRMDEAERLYRRLGFTLTPRGRHTLGSINHLAIFATDYLELIGLSEDAGGRQELLEWPLGWNGVVFNTEDAAGLQAGLAEAGVAAGAPNDFSRPVALEDGVFDAAFRTVRMPNETTPAGRLYWCEHKTRGLVWRDAWRRHRNGVVGVARVVYVAENPARLLGVLAAMFGAEAVSPDGVMPAGMASVEVITPAAAEARYGDAVADAAGRPEWIAAMEFRVLDVGVAAETLMRGGFTVRSGVAGPVVAAADAMGAAMVFVSG